MSVPSSAALIRRINTRAHENINHQREELVTRFRDWLRDNYGHGAVAQFDAEEIDEDGVLPPGSVRTRHTRW